MRRLASHSHAQISKNLTRNAAKRHQVLAGSRRRQGQGVEDAPAICTALSHMWARGLRLHLAPAEVRHQKRKGGGTLRALGGRGHTWCSWPGGGIAGPVLSVFNRFSPPPPISLRVNGRPDTEEGAAADVRAEGTVRLGSPRCRLELSWCVTEAIRHA